jgi:hypothetical protein
MAFSIFIPGVVCLYVGLALFAVDMAFVGVFRKLPIYIKILSGIFYVLATIIVSGIWIFRPAPFEITAASNVPTYGLGSKVYGIDWKARRCRKGSK